MIKVAIHKLTVSAATMSGAFAASSPLAAADLLVPEQFPTVQAAIAASADGDVIRITVPYIAEHGIEIQGRRIDIEGSIKTQGGAVTIDAQLLGRHLTVGSGSKLGIRNLRLVNGRGGSSGGAVRFAGDEIRILDCTFEGNQAADGGAIWLGGAKANIGRSVLSSNAAVGASFTYGGGVRHVAGELTVWSTRFSGNYAGYHGGGISHGWGNGGGQYAGRLELSSCLFDANSSLYGGALHGYRPGGSIRIHNATFANNSASVGSACVNYYCEIRLVNSVIAGPGSLFQLYYGGSYRGLSCITSSGSLPGLGNRMINPMLSGNFSPLPGSPCIDAGSVGFPLSEFFVRGEGSSCRAIDVDLLGNPRVSDELAVMNSGCALSFPVDIGAIETPGAFAEVPVIGDLDGDASVDAADLFQLLSTWGMESCAADLSLNGSVGPEDIALLFGSWGDCPP